MAAKWQQPQGSFPHRLVSRVGKEAIPTCILCLSLKSKKSYLNHDRLDYIVVTNKPPNFSGLKQSKHIAPAACLTQIC